MPLMKRVIAAALAAAIAVGAGWYIVSRDSGGTDPGEAKRTQPQLPDIGISAPDFVSRFNETSGSDPLDFELGEPTWVHDDAINLDIASYSISDWSLVELYRNSQEQITAVYFVARPSDAEQRALFLNIATSVVATTMRVDREAASSVVRTDLNAENSDGGDLDQKIERFGLKFALTFKDAAYQLTVTNAKASTPRS